MAVIKPRSLILELSGEITALEAGTIKKKIADLPLETGDRLFLDLSRVNYIDSAGLGVLVAAFKRLSEYGGGVMLFGLRPRVKAVLDVTRMSQVFNVVDELPPPDEPDAGVTARRRPPNPSDSSDATANEGGE